MGETATTDPEVLPSCIFMTTLRLKPETIDHLSPRAAFFQLSCSFLRAATRGNKNHNQLCSPFPAVPWWFFICASWSSPAGSAGGRWVGVRGGERRSGWGEANSGWTAWSPCSEAAPELDPEHVEASLFWFCKAKVKGRERAGNTKMTQFNKLITLKRT